MRQGSLAHSRKRGGQHAHLSHCGTGVASPSWIRLDASPANTAQSGRCDATRPAAAARSFQGKVHMTQTILRKVGARLIKAVPTLRSDRDLANYMREHVLPIPPVTPDDTLNKPVTRLDPPGLDFRAEAQIALLASFRSSRHQALFKALRSDPIINKM